MAAKTETMDQCIQNCTECHRVCIETIRHCLQQGGKHAEAPHIRLLADCLQICQTSADFMIRDSELHGETCAVCADICERCASDCDRFGDDPVMKHCFDVCRRCAQSCRDMADARPGRRVA